MAPVPLGGRHPLVIAAFSGGELDRAVALEAARLAGALGAEWVVALHVVDTSRLPEPPDTPAGAAFLESLRLRGVRVLEEAARMLRGLGVDAVKAAREGRPCAEIVSLAREAGADVVVVGRGSRGLGGVARCVLTHWRGALLAAVPRGRGGG